MKCAEEVEADIFAINISDNMLVRHFTMDVSSRMIAVTSRDSKCSSLNGQFGCTAVSFSDVANLAFFWCSAGRSSWDLAEKNICRSIDTQKGPCPESAYEQR